MIEVQHTSSSGNGGAGAGGDGGGGKGKSTAKERAFEVPWYTIPPMTQAIIAGVSSVPDQDYESGIGSMDGSGGFALEQVQAQLVIPVSATPPPASSAGPCAATPSTRLDATVGLPPSAKVEAPPQLGVHRDVVVIDIE
jgi:hypothetical protein